MGAAAGDGARLDGRRRVLPVRGRRVVRRLRRGRQIIAPDWRGYGLTTGPAPTTTGSPTTWPTWTLLDHYRPRPVDLVGHSMGGNVVMHVRGARPERIRRLVNLEGFGGPATRRPRRRTATPSGWTSSRRCTAARWTSALRHGRRRGAPPDENQPAPVAGQGAPVLWLAHQWAKADGPMGNPGRPAHKIINAQTFSGRRGAGPYRRR